MPDRVTPIPVETNPHDRLAELHFVPPEIKAMLHPVGTPMCDFDFIVTSRIPVIPMYRVLSGRPSGFGKGIIRGIFGLEEMPILSFRTTVPWAGITDIQTLSSYLLSDGIMINNLWTEKLLSKLAGIYLSPSKRKELATLVQEVVPVKLSRLNLRSGKLIMKDGFNVGFTGRVTATRSFDKVAELFRKQFAYPIGKNKKEMKFIVSTNSKTFGARTEEGIGFVDVQYNNRESFYATLKSLHVVLNLSEVEDFSLSTYETLLAGVPVIVYDKPWNAFLGPDYPFRVSNELEAYALLNSFTSSYSTQYARFAAWERSWWCDLVEGPKNLTTSEALWSSIEAFSAARRDYIIQKGLGGSYRDVAASLYGQESINFLETMEKLGKGVFKENVMLMRSPSTLMLKELLYLIGYEDAKAPGAMVSSGSLVQLTAE